MVEEVFDGDDVARILRRAQALEGREPDDTPSAGVTSDALIEAAAEVGIDRDAVRDSIALEQLDATTPEAKTFDGLAGPAVVVVERELPMSVADVLAALEVWLTTRHRMRCIPERDGTVRFHRRTDTAASIGRRVSGMRGEGRLGHLDRITIRAAPQVVGTTPDSPRTIVRVEADRVGTRRTRLTGGASLGAAGVGGAVVVAVEGAILLGPVVAIPALGAGYVAARSGRTQAERVELEIERLLTSVERQESPSRRRRTRRTFPPGPWAGMMRHD